MGNELADIAADIGRLGAGSPDTVGAATVAAG